jgi:hypothetical protein
MSTVMTKAMLAKGKGKRPNDSDVTAWLPAIETKETFVVVTLPNLEAAVLASLSDCARLAEDCRLGAEFTPLVARHVYSVRRPSPSELGATEALLKTVLRPCDVDAGRNDDLYESWEVVGRSGVRMSLNDLAHLKPYVSTRYPEVGKWHREFLDEHLTPMGPYGGFKLDYKRFRQHVETVIDDTISAVWGSVALRVDEQLSDSRGAALVGEIGNRLVVEVPSKNAQRLKEKLEAAIGELLAGIPLPCSVEISKTLV